MERRLPAGASLLYYLILALVFVGLGWAYLLPLEVTVSGRGAVSFMGNPQAVCAAENGAVGALWSKTGEEVKDGQKILSLKETAAGVNLQQQEIAAPTGGIILWQQELLPGDLVVAGERLAVVYPPSPLGVKVFLREQELGRVQPGMPVRISLDAYPYQNFGVIKGKVKEFELQNQPLPGKEMQVVVLIAIEEIPDQMKLQPGLAANVEIIMGETRLLQKLLFD